MSIADILGLNNTALLGFGYTTIAGWTYFIMARNAVGGARFLYLLLCLVWPIGIFLGAILHAVAGEALRVIDATPTEEEVEKQRRDIVYAITAFFIFVGLAVVLYLVAG